MSEYPKYKIAGFEWLGEVPNHWDIVRIKDYTYLKARIGWQGLRSDEFIENTNWYCVTGTDFNNGSIDWANCYCVEKNRFDQDKKIQLKLNDLLITKDGTIGKVALINELPKKATLNSGVFVTRPIKNKYSNQFMYWLLSSNVFTKFIDYNKNGSTILHLYQNVFERFFYCLPNDSEQIAIAQYLNTKTQTIDKKINLLIKKVDYYKELCKSIINEAVCRGLDKAVPLKNSGIEWIGEIPKHWQVKRLKDVGYLYSGLSGKTGEHFNQEVSDKSQHYIPFTNIANNKYINHEDLHTVLMDENERQNKVKKNDLFFLMSSEGFADIGKSALLIEDVKDTYLNSFCKGYRITKKTVDPKYLNYLLNSPSFRDKFIVQGKGFTRINLKMEKVSDFEFIIPPVEEQTAIAEHLDKKTTTIDAIVANIKLQIDNLKELRKTLINDVVTGKLKVTEDEKG